SACASGARPTPEDTSTDASEGRMFTISTWLGTSANVWAGPLRPSESKITSSSDEIAPAGSHCNGLAPGSPGSVFGTLHVHVSVPTPFGSLQTSPARAAPSVGPL